MFMSRMALSILESSILLLRTPVMVLF
uniref:Uncharacterized protein n=1 Tax=Lotus japonicus TaxID=34305 RepID=I3S6B5_LOTJA|nr:unknown [Lotus japonicus]